MHIAGREYSKKEILRYIGNISQLGGTRHYVLDEGRSKGVKAVDFDTGTGFRFTVLPDRGLDISCASYKGTNLVYLTPNGEVHPAYYEPRKSGWLRSFFGGLLTTCGLTHFGAPTEDGDEELGLHGRHSSSPASKVCDLSRWENDEYILEIKGVVEDAVLFGNCLRLTRSIKTKIGAKSLSITDHIENFGYRTSPFTILYHINPGFPLLSEKSTVVITSEKAEPLQEYANINSIYEIGPPERDFLEEDFTHIMAHDNSGYSYAGVINQELLGGLGLYVRFNVRELPYLNEWKMLSEGEYVTAIEPCNAPCRSRTELREMGLLQSLEPGENKTIEIEIGVLEGYKEIDIFRETAQKVLNR